MRIIRFVMAVLAVLTICVSVSFAGLWPRRLFAYQGSTPTLDGKIAAGEYKDAWRFTGTIDWTHTFSPTEDKSDLSLIGWVKHDGNRLYFAFDVTDDLLYGIDTERWIPAEFPDIHKLDRSGFPWFGDEMEILINASNSIPRGEHTAGTAGSWQMVCNLTKSRLGGIGVGGLMEGEPRANLPTWNLYQTWILNKAQEAVARPKPEGKGYIIEWAISFDPCLEITPGKYYSPKMGKYSVGMNIALGDIDLPEDGVGNFANFHHEDWFAGRQWTRTIRREWGKLWLMPCAMP